MSERESLLVESFREYADSAALGSGVGQAAVTAAGWNRPEESATGYACETSKEAYGGRLRPDDAAERAPQVLPIGATPCPKCSPGTDVSVSYHPRRSYCNPHSRYTFNSREDEHLHYTCRNCGYDWTGDVADAG